MERRYRFKEEDDPFIGQRFGAEGQLEVLRWSGRTKGCILEYDLVCHTCKQDTEQYGEAIFKSVKGSLLRGIIPCGCATCYRPTKAQYELRIDRRCKEVGKTFLGFAEEFVNGDSLVLLQCNEDGTKLPPTTIKNLLCRAIGCKTCIKRWRDDRLNTEGEEFIKKFWASGKFIEGTEFKRVGGSKGWSYTCPKCSSDRYVAAGVCGGVFYSTATALSIGELSCRCTKRFRWTKEQREYSIRDAMRGIEVRTQFVEWLGKYNHTKSRFLANCELHGDWETTVSTFLNHGSRCPSCAQGGYKPSEDGYLYVLRARNAEGCFTGYGISNKPKNRLSQHRSSLKKEGFVIEDLKVFKTTGPVARAVESLLITNFEPAGQSVTGFKREATKFENFAAVMMFSICRLLELNPDASSVYLS